jgi:hypothetical protein
LQVLFAPEGEEELEREVSWYAENVADPDSAQVGYQKVAKRHTALHRVDTSSLKLIVTETAGRVRFPAYNRRPSDVVHFKLCFGHF